MNNLIEGEPRAADFDLAARHLAAKQSLAALEYQVNKLKMQCQREVEQLRIPIEQARARVRRLTPAYNDMCYRLRIDPHTDLDLPDDEEEE